jgi:hypothetical protein
MLVVRTLVLHDLVLSRLTRPYWSIALILMGCLYGNPK